MNPRTMLLRAPRVAAPFFLPSSTSRLTPSSALLNTFFPSVPARHLSTETSKPSTSTSASAPPPQPPPPSSASPTPKTRVLPQTTLNARAGLPRYTIPKTYHPASPSSAKRTGTVISAGLMDRTVRVEYKHTFYHTHLRKLYPTKRTYLVSDPNNSLREGDVIEFSSGWRKSKHVRHVVDRIIAPFGEKVEDRPAVLGKEARETLRKEEKGEIQMGKITRKVMQRVGPKRRQASVKQVKTFLL
ncbi:hypothetical protein AJ80_01723 [Polytolypa hystricis UAMH7299]|uniref:Ribosomal protein S17 n=1 Tax=Polytolypa hystricis (strain UAMH7299) TaxID=1447883 RepID=A0A2B7YRF5_POLH7|nr:hypothetical protein AJ80_01723 [Polytolypa hystricis UAMH7299]